MLEKDNIYEIKSILRMILDVSQLSLRKHGAHAFHMNILVKLACSAEVACRLYILSVYDVVCQMVLVFCLARWFLTDHDDALQGAESFLEYFSFLTKGKYRYFK